MANLASFLQRGSAFTNSSSAHPIGEDQKRLGGDTAWLAAPLKVTIVLVVVLEGVVDIVEEGLLGDVGGAATDVVSGASLGGLLQ